MRIEYHCGAPMEHAQMPLLRSSNIRHVYSCTYCNHQEEQVVTRSGNLLYWKNLTAQRAKERAA